MFSVAIQNISAALTDYELKSYMFSLEFSEMFGILNLFHFEMKNLPLRYVVFQSDLGWLLL